MQLIGRKNDKNVMLVDDDDDAYEENGIQVMVLTGEEFLDIVRHLPMDKAQALLDKHYEANFKHHCGNFYASNVSTVICQSCGEVLKLTSKEEHIKACYEAEIAHRIRMMQMQQQQ